MSRRRKSEEITVKKELIHHTRFRKSVSSSMEKLPVIPLSKATAPNGRTASRKTMMSTSREEFESQETAASESHIACTKSGKDAVVETARRKDGNVQKMQSVLPPATSARKPMVVLPPCEVLLLHQNTNAVENANGLEMLANCSSLPEKRDEIPSHGSVVPELIGANEVIEDNTNREMESDVTEHLCNVVNGNGKLHGNGKLDGKFAEMLMNAPDVISKSNAASQLVNMHLVVPNSTGQESPKKKRGRKPKATIILDQESPPTLKQRGRKPKALLMLDAPILIQPDDIIEYSERDFPSYGDDKSARSPSPVLPLIITQQNVAKIRKSMPTPVESKVPVIQNIPTVVSRSSSAVEASDSVGSRSSGSGSRMTTGGAALQLAAKSKPAELTIPAQRASGSVSGVVPVRAVADSTQSLSPNVSPNLPRTSLDQSPHSSLSVVYEPPMKKLKSVHNGNITVSPSKKATPKFSASDVFTTGTKPKPKSRRRSAQDGTDGADNGRMLMRQWLEKEADDPEGGGGIEWFDRWNKMIKIAWKHGSKSGWSANDSRVFVNWAKYTGRYKEGDGEYKRWKANFRCALRSLPDVKEVKDKIPSKNGEQFKVYQLLEPAPRKRSRGSSESTPMGGPMPRRCSTGSSQPRTSFLPQFDEDELAVQSLCPNFSTSIPIPVDLPSPTSSSSSSPLPMETTPPTFVPDTVPVCVSTNRGSFVFLTVPSVPNGSMPFCFQFVGNGDPSDVDSSTDHSYANAVLQSGLATVVRPALPPTPSPPLLPSQQTHRNCNSVIPTVVDRFSLSSDEESETEEEDKKPRSVPVDSTTSFHTFPLIQQVAFQPTCDYHQLNELIPEQYHEMQPLQLGDVKSSIPAVSVISFDGACDFDSPPRPTDDDLDGMDLRSLY